MLLAPHLRSLFRRLATVAVLTCVTQQSWAWGREGHRLTALVAEHYLTPAAKEQVRLLLGKETLAGVAPWADQYRVDHPETGRWHHVDIPRDQEKYNRTRDCPPSATDPNSPWRDCVTDRILYFEGRLGDESLPREQRAQALKFVVHLIGDVHQPFHALGDERGGNNIRVSLLGSSQCGDYICNLHGVWDDSLLEQRGLSEEKYTALLLQEIKDHDWEALAGGEPGTWATLSHRYAVEAMAPNGALLTREYVAAEEKVVDQQLGLAGLRLAHVLDRIFAADTDQGTKGAAPDRKPLPQPPAAPPA